MSENVYRKFTAAGLSHMGACAMLGNFEAESALRPNNLQNSFEQSGISDEVYTLAVDNGLYKNFANDQAGYGYAQWTHPDRKKQLLAFVQQRGVSIGDGDAQIDFAIEELKSGYTELYSYLCSTGDLAEATARVCKEYERPAVNNISVRLAYAEKWEKYFTLNGMAAQQAEPQPQTPDKLAQILTKLDEIIALLKE